MGADRRPQHERDRRRHSRAYHLARKLGAERISGTAETRRSCRRAQIGFAVPAIFGICLLALWELLTRGLAIRNPASAPSVIVARPSMHCQSSALMLQTVFKEVLPGYAIGCGAGLLAAFLIDRSPFLKAGLLRSAISSRALRSSSRAAHDHVVRLRMPSKAAIIVTMIFFPMLINTITGLAASGHMERDLMRTYAASWPQTLLKLRLPAAWPFIFNAAEDQLDARHDRRDRRRILRLALGRHGLRISTEMGRMNTAMVWAEILAAAIAGSLFTGSSRSSSARSRSGIPLSVGGRGKRQAKPASIMVPSVVDGRTQKEG